MGKGGRPEYCEHKKSIMIMHGSKTIRRLILNYAFECSLSALSFPEPVEAQSSEFSLGAYTIH